uniref:Uncharacterized protein n=1 Tax=Opuntia streptacantha TaxID=393608 RepID=A0A7C8YE21_OPUST
MTSVTFTLGPLSSCTALATPPLSLARRTSPTFSLAAYNRPLLRFLPLICFSISSGKLFHWTLHKKTHHFFFFNSWFDLVAALTAFDCLVPTFCCLFSYWVFLLFVFLIRSIQFLGLD